jgi:hypothetical protein
VLAEPRKLLPAGAAVGGVEERGVLDARVQRVGIAAVRFEMPDARELPGVTVLAAIAPSRPVMIRSATSAQPI